MKRFRIKHHSLDFLPHDHRERQKQKHSLSLGTGMLIVAVVSATSALIISQKNIADDRAEFATTHDARLKMDANFTGSQQDLSSSADLVAQADAWRAANAEPIAGELLKTALPEASGTPLSLQYTAATSSSTMASTGQLKLVIGGSDEETRNAIRRLNKSSLIADTVVMNMPGDDGAAMPMIRARVDGNAAAAARLLHAGDSGNGVADVSVEAR